MPRIERSEDERRRIGVPSDQKRIDVLERLVNKLMALSITNELPAEWANDPDIREFGEIKDKLDQLDNDHPNER